MRILLLLLFSFPVFAHDAHKHHQEPVRGIVSLDVYRDGGTIHVLTGEAASVWHRRTTDGGASWSKPIRVDGPSVAPSGMRPGNDAQIAASGDRLLALWPVAGTGWGGSGPFATARSSDGGRTWLAGRSPSDTGSTDGHGFADLLFDERGLHAVWLDGRDKSQGLRYARSVDGGATWSANVTIAPGTCECCWNSLAGSNRQGESLHVMYRGKAPRDMSLASFRTTTWERRGALAPFNWHVKGCPETGGGLVVAPDGGIHATVWTGLPGKEGLYYVGIRDTGGRWSDPARIGSRAAQHSDLAVSAHGELAVVWDDADSIRLSRSRDGGHSWSKAESVTGAADAASHPRVVSTANGYLLLWTERSRDGTRELRTTIRK